MVRTHVLLLTVLSAFAAAGCVQERPRRSPAPAGARLIPIAPHVRVEVVDWGGQGQPLIFLAGLGNTAHVFDGFAPQFADRYHVFGITRRGFGASAGAVPPNHLDTLVADLTATLDSLGLGRVILVGHSIAGEEMTRFAELHRERCASLVYLDAAYDRAGLDTLAAKQPSAPGPRIRAADTASFASLRALYARVLGVNEPESDIRATARFDAADRYQGPVTSNALKARIASDTQVARYDRVHCRALALYAIPDSIVDVIPYYTELNATGLIQAESLRAFTSEIVAAARTATARLPDFQVAALHHSNHYLFLQYPHEVAATMRNFLGARSLSPAP